MSSYDDDEALFEDIYGDEEKTTVKDETEKKEEAETTTALSTNESGPESSTTESMETKPQDTKTEQLTEPPQQEYQPAQQATSSIPPVPSAQPSQQQIYSTGFPPQAGQVAHAPQDFQQTFQQAQGMGQPQLPPPPPQPMPPSNMGKESGKMFIGGLNWDTTEQGLVDYFSKYGEVIDHTIMRDSTSGKSRGFGFLTFKDPKSVDEVIKTDHILDGKLIDPKRAIAREEQDKVGKIFVGGIDPMVNEKEFNDFFAQFGSIIDAQLMIDKDTGRSRGFGFITYDSPEAVDRVTVNKYLSLKGKSMEVKRAEPRGQHQQNVLQQQQQQQQQQYGSFNPYASQYGQTPYQQQGMSAYSQGMSGMSPEMMQEYWQRMQQWYMYQQQAAQAQVNPADFSQQQTQQTEQPAQPLNPQQQASEPQESQEPEIAGSGSDGSSQREQRRLNLPKGPRRAPPAGPSGTSRGRGGYQHRSRGYHPYSRGGRR